MIRRPVRSFISLSRAALAAASVAVCAAGWAVPGDTLAQASGTPANTSTATSTTTPAVEQTYAVKPGQSLNDIAGELTGSKDRDVRQKIARALFDANPNAFGNHDINKLKLGSTLNVPVMDAGAAAASEPVAQDNVAEAAAAPAQTEALAPATTTATAASDSAVAPASSAESASSTEPQQAAPTSEATPASAPAPTASAPAPSRTGPDPMLFGIGIAVLVGLFLLFKMRGGKKRRKAKPAPTSAPALAEDPRVPRTFASLEEAQADADARNAALRRERAAGAAANLETEPVQRGQSELNAVAASIDSDDAAKAETTPTEDEAPTAIPEAYAAPAEPSQPSHGEPFTPRALAAHHAGFVPPTVTASTDAEVHARDSEAREAAVREAQKWESQEREAATRQAAAHDAEERERHARETAAREALVRDLHARELQLLAEEVSEAVENEEEAQRAREAVAREIIAQEAELRDAQARAAEETAAEQRAIDEADSDAHEGEIFPGLRFPMPKFPQEAILALDSLDLNLPPRMELTLNPGGTVTSSHGAQSEPPRAASPIEAAPYVPHPMADAQPLYRPEDESVVTQIEAETAGAASVAGLGAMQFPPLSLDFDMNLPNQSAPLPPAQLAAIARNKLELAGEYIELGELPGARTLLQEVMIGSNDPATCQKAATLLSTLPPHS